MKRRQRSETHQGQWPGPAALLGRQKLIVFCLFNRSNWSSGNVPVMSIFDKEYFRARKVVGHRNCERGLKKEMNFLPRVKICVLNSSHSRSLSALPGRKGDDPGGG